MAHADAILPTTTPTDPQPAFNMEKINRHLAKVSESKKISNPNYPQFYVNAIVSTLNEIAYDSEPESSATLTYFEKKNMAEFLDYLNSLIREKLYRIDNDEVFTNACLDPSESEGWAGLKEELSQVLGDSRMENTAFFTRFTLKLNEVLASLHQKNEKNILFKNDYDNKYVEVLRSDREKPDIGFDNPHVIKVNSTSVSVCEIMGKRPRQEDQYHVGKLEINKESAPSVLKGILNQCEVEAEKIRGSGSTATLTHLSPQGILTVASVGDSPAMFMAKDKTTSEVVMISINP